MVGTSSGSTNLKYKLTKKCNNFTLRVTKYLPNSGQSITLGNAPLYTFHALIPKLNKKQNINVEIFK